jgi:hypothetical protein
VQSLFGPRASTLHQQLAAVLCCLQGPGALYWGFVPFLIESFPYDLTELGTYSQLHDMREEALRKGSPSSKWMAQVPEQVRFATFVTVQALDSWFGL